MELNENSVKILEMIIKKKSGQIIEYLKEIVGTKAAYDLADEITDELEFYDLIETKGARSGITIAFITPKGREYIKGMILDDYAVFAEE